MPEATVCRCKVKNVKCYIATYIMSCQFCTVKLMPMHAHIFLDSAWSILWIRRQLYPLRQSYFVKISFIMKQCFRGAAVHRVVRKCTLPCHSMAFNLLYPHTVHADHRLLPIYKCPIQKCKIIIHAQPHTVVPLLQATYPRARRSR